MARLRRRSWASPQPPDLRRCSAEVDRLTGSALDRMRCVVVVLWARRVWRACTREFARVGSTVGHASVLIEASGWVSPGERRPGLEAGL